MSTRKSHKSKRQWKTPAEPGSPESSQASVSSSSDTPIAPTTAVTAVSSSLLSEDGHAQDVPTPAGALVATAPPLPEKPYWYRPPDSKARKLCEKIVVMRTAGRDDAYIAKKLGTTSQTVKQYVYLGHKNGWLDAEGEPVDLEAELSLEVDRKVVRNINRSLDGTMTNWQTHEMTISAAKGRGIFKNHEKSDGQDTQALPIVAIQVVMPPVGASDQVVVEANVGGVAAFVEGQVVEGA